MVNNILETKIKPREWKGLEPGQVGRHGHFFVTARCQAAGCETSEVLTFHGFQPPRVVIQRFTRDGWSVKNKLKCPAHAGHRRRNGTMPSSDHVDSAEAASARIAAGAATRSEKPGASDGAKKGKRLVYLALEDYYDERAKGYKPGRTDASVAAECGVSEAVVRQVREDDFGPLAPPSEAQALIAAAAEATKAVAEMETDLRAKLAAAKIEVATLNRNLDALCLKNGWKR